MEKLLSLEYLEHPFEEETVECKNHDEDCSEADDHNHILGAVDLDALLVLGGGGHDAAADVGHCHHYSTFMK